MEKELKEADMGDINESVSAQQIDRYINRTCGVLS